MSSARDELEGKINAIQLLVLDVDGVLTDGRTFRGSGGVEGAFFSVQDGTGIKCIFTAVSVTRDGKIRKRTSYSPIKGDRVEVRRSHYAR